jgi:hypothetical protein
LTSGWYGFLNKKKRVDSRLFQVQASFDLVNWRTAKVFDTGKAPFIFKDSKTIRYGRRFFRLRPYTIPLEPPFNRIDPNYELFEAQQIDGNLDGQAHELFESEYVNNPGFEVASEGQRAQWTYLSGDLTYAQFAEHDEGTWDGITDHSVSIGLGWNPEGIHLIVIVEDDVHHHTKEEADQGDAVRVLFTDANRGEVMSEYLFALVEPYLGDGTLYDKNTMANTVKGSVLGHTKQLAGKGEFDVVILRTQKTIYPHTGTTIYEMSFSPEAIGLESLQKNVKFGLGVAVIDSDPDAPGLQGWSGWGPESVVLETNPAETALITLGGNRGGDGGE